MKNQIWQGVLIEESVEDPAVLKNFHLIGSADSTLEGEEERGVFHFHRVQVDDMHLDEVLKLIAKYIKSGWYFHLVGGDSMKIVFKDKIFEVERGNKIMFEVVRQYGENQGIKDEQMEFEYLLDHPFD